MTIGGFVAVLVGVVGILNGGNVTEEIVIAPVTGGGNTAEGLVVLRGGKGP